MAAQSRRRHRPCANPAVACASGTAAPFTRRGRVGIFRGVSPLPIRVERLPRWARLVALALGLSVFFTLIGPFGSFADPLPERLLACFAYGGSGLLIWGPGYPLLLRWAERARIPPLPARLLSAFAISAPVAAVSVLVARLIWRPVQPPNLLLVYSEVASVAVPLALGYYGLQVWAARQAATSTVAEAPPRILERLPAALGTELLALEAEDHYVRVHTAKGSTLLLMRFSDAVAELDGLRGMQVHRSWWVARTAVAGAAKTGRRAELLLTNGIRAPIARTAMPEARAMGLLGVRA